jgi:hypothetical protein
VSLLLVEQEIRVFVVVAELRKENSPFELGNLQTVSSRQMRLGRLLNWTRCYLLVPALKHQDEENLMKVIQRSLFASR